MDKTVAYDHIFKLLIIGDAGVGKSSLLMRFSDRNYTNSYTNTIGLDLKVHTITLEGKRIRLQLWDTAGQERFRTITTAYYRGVHGILIVFDVTNLNSFNNVTNWIYEASRYSGEVPQIMVGNKADAEERVVKQEDIEKYAERQGIKYVETSAKTSQGVEEAFTELTRQALKMFPAVEPAQELLKPSKKPKNTCC